MCDTKRLSQVLKQGKTFLDPPIWLPPQTPGLDPPLAPIQMTIFATNLLFETKHLWRHSISVWNKIISWIMELLIAKKQHWNWQKQFLNAKK